MNQREPADHLFSLLDERLFGLVDECDEKALARRLRELGFFVSSIDGKDISDGRMALKHVAIALGCPSNHASWYDLTDAFSDLRYRSEIRRVLLWKNVSATMDRCLLEFLWVVKELLNMVEPPLILDEEHCEDNEHEFASFGLILTGNRPAFKRIDLEAGFILPPSWSTGFGEGGTHNVP